MKILAINGSPKGKDSSTNVMIDSFLEGAKKEGAIVETLELKGKDINFCTGCFSCWTKTPGECVFNDDVREILFKLLDADIVVLASPLYSDHISGNLKVFIDRWLPLGTPYFEKDENGEYRHGDKKINDRKTPRFIMMCNCGFPEDSHFNVVSDWFNRFVRNCKGENVAEIYRNQGPLINSKIEALAPVIDGYKTLLEEAGRQVALGNPISQELQEELTKNLIPQDIYIANATKRFDNERK